MYAFDAVGWLNLHKFIVKRAAAIETVVNRDAPLSTHTRQRVIDFFERMSATCEDTGLATAAQMAADMKEGANRSGYTEKNHLEDVLTLKRTIIANMKALRFLRVPHDYIKFAEDNPFKSLYDAFPSAIRDMEAAGLSLAYGLGTGSVFHLMRVMEVGLKQFAVALEIPYAPSWDAYLKKLEAKMSEKHKDKTADWKRDEPYFRDLIGDLQLVKFVWRNPTMHIARHYSQEEAREIFTAACAFMNRVGQRFAESTTSPEQTS